MTENIYSHYKVSSGLTNARKLLEKLYSHSIILLKLFQKLKQI